VTACGGLAACCSCLKLHHGEDKIRSFKLEINEFIIRNY